MPFPSRCECRQSRQVRRRADRASREVCHRVYAIFASTDSGTWSGTARWEGRSRSLAHLPEVVQSSRPASISASSSDVQRSAPDPRRGLHASTRFRARRSVLLTLPRTHYLKFWVPNFPLGDIRFGMAACPFLWVKLFVHLVQPRCVILKSVLVNATVVRHGELAEAGSNAGVAELLEYGDGTQPRFEFDDPVVGICRMRILRTTSGCRFIVYSWLTFHAVNA